MSKFTLTPVADNETGIAVDMTIESSTRRRAFCGVLTFTRNEWQDFRDLLKKGLNSGHELEFRGHLDGEKQPRKTSKKS